MFKTLLSLSFILVGFSAESSCFETIEEIIDAPNTQVIYKVSNKADSISYCTKKKLFSFSTKSEKIADITESSFLDKIDVNQTFAHDILEASELKKNLESLRGTEQGRKISLIASLNGNDGIDLSNLDYTVMNYEISLKSTSKMTETMVEKLSQRLLYQYKMSEYLGKPVRICDDIEDLQVIDQMMNPVVLGMAQSSVTIMEVVICESKQTLILGIQLDPKDPRYLKTENLDSQTGEDSTIR